MECEDGNLCTDDRCDPVRGCVHECVCAACTAVPDCGESSECDDHDACTRDTCVAGAGVPVGACGDGPVLVCSYSPVDCDDSNAATQDYCLPEVGCVHSSCYSRCASGADCGSDGKCYTTRCVAHPSGCGTTCAYDPIDCDDQDPCTRDSCDEATGFVACDPAKGCQHTRVWACP